MGIYKRCAHKARQVERCEDPWWGSFRGYRVSLRKWTDRDIGTKTEATEALDELRTTIRQLTQAGRTRDEIQAALKAGKMAAEPRHEVMMFETFADLFWTRHAIRLKSANTVKYRLAKVKAYYTNRPITQITRADVEAYLDGLAQPSKFHPSHKQIRLRQGATINRHRALLVKMFSWAVAEGLRPNTPFNNPGIRGTLVAQRPENDERNRRLSNDEEQRLMAAACPTLRLLITAALYTGMRRGEMLSLTWADLADRAGYIRLEGRKTKTGQRRYVRILPKVQAVFDFLRCDAAGNEKPPETTVFSNEVGEPVRSFRTAWSKALRRAKIDDYHWHDLRHEFATRILESGKVSLIHVRDLLGHASVVTTQRYTNLDDAALKAAVNTLVQKSSEPAEVSQSFHTDASDQAEPQPSRTANSRIS